MKHAMAGYFTDFWRRWMRHPRVIATANRILPYRLGINVLVHALLFGLGYAYSVVLLNGLVIDEYTVGTFYQTVPPLVGIRLVSFYFHDLFRGMWRFVSFEDLINILRAVIISSLLFYLAGLAWPVVQVSDALYILDLTFCILFSGGIRVLVRNFRERHAISARSGDLKRMALVGPIEKIQPLLKDVIGDPQSHYLPVVVIDPTLAQYSAVTRLCDVPVMSAENLLSRRQHFGKVDDIVFCWPGSSQRQIDAIVEKLQVLSIPFKTMPHLEDILNGRVSISDIREVGIEDLLERPPITIDMGQIRHYLEGKTILVTGGGGSIGSEICRQVAGFNPKMLVLVERCENSLYDLLVEFRRGFPQTKLAASISSVNDRAGLCSLMQRYRVDVVFHAAAYKHVPLMEEAPLESAYNNIEGTFNVVQAALSAGVQRFVMISTDKAVNPTNVMGVTKRIAEMIVQSCSGAGPTRFMTVRFGNVLGSAGSVIPLFKKQILNGGPLTVTHPDIERYFMTIPEAVQLVLQAGCMGQGGEIFVLDMGEPVKILKLAEKLISLSGKKPYEDIDIQFTGLRPGEKMYEELFNTGEKHIPTSHPRIDTAVSLAVSKQFMEAQERMIRDIIISRDESALREKFFELVPGYHCGPSPDETLRSCRLPVGPERPAVDPLPFGVAGAFSKLVE